MYRIDNATASGTLPAPTADGPNPDSYFTDGNPGLGVPATVVDAEWANSIQEEIANVIEDAGINLDKADRTQLLQAITAKIAPVASAAEVRAAADTAKAVTPGRVKDSPFTADLVFTFQIRSGPGACTMIGTTYGGTVSVDNIAAARYQVTLPTMANATYRVAVSVGSAADGVSTAHRWYDKTTTGFKLRVTDMDNTSIDGASDTFVDVMVFGAPAP